MMEPTRDLGDKVIPQRLGVDFDRLSDGVTGVVFGLELLLRAGERAAQVRGRIVTWSFMG